MLGVSGMLAGSHLCTDPGLYLFNKQKTLECQATQREPRHEKLEICAHLLQYVLTHLHHAMAVEITSLHHVLWGGKGGRQAHTDDTAHASSIVLPSYL